MNDLVILENVNAVEIFNGEGLDDLLSRITEEAKSLIPDLSTDKSRKEIASMAYKVSKSKTHLDELGKDLGSKWRDSIKAVDVERKKVRDTLDALRDEVRKPLTDWENKDKERIENHKASIQWFVDAGESAINFIQFELKTLTARLAEVDGVEISEKWDEFASDAAIAKDRAATLIKEAIVKREAYDKEQAELEKLRAEAAEREQKDREEKLRLEGEERARLEAEKEKERETIAALEREASIERERQAAIQAKEEAEKRAKQVEENAKIEVEKAAQAERDRIDQERINEELAAKKREADKKHKAKINNAAAKAMRDSLLAYDSGERSLTLGQAKLIVTAIAQGKVPHTKISY